MIKSNAAISKENAETCHPTGVIQPSHVFDSHKREHTCNHIVKSDVVVCDKNAETDRPTNFVKPSHLFGSQRYNTCNHIVKSDVVVCDKNAETDRPTDFVKPSHMFDPTNIGSKMSNPMLVTALSTRLRNTQISH
jgi:hypothetical protein